jgi:hypothetical protein
MERNDHARKVHFMFKRSRPLGAFYGQEATMPARCVLWSRSDHARKVRFMVKKRHYRGFPFTPYEINGLFEIFSRGQTYRASFEDFTFNQKNWSTMAA